MFFFFINYDTIYYIIGGKYMSEETSLANNEKDKILTSENKLKNNIN